MIAPLPTKRRGPARLAALLALAMSAPAAGQTVPPSEPAAPPPAPLAWPLACQPGTDCWIINYFDVDPGPEATDYRCGTRTFDGHKGTDIAIRDMAAMEEGVPVLAAAGGVVRGLRDEVQDISVEEIGEDAVRGRECGNGVLIDHGGGWSTQYCHMSLGSVAVGKGDRVEAGHRLGLVGLSGLTKTPHLHFAVRRQGVAVDPFLGADGDTCGASGNPLWRPEVSHRVAYRSFDIYNSGFAPGVPRVEDVRKGLYRGNAMPSSSEALVVWVDILGVEKGDRLVLKVLDPDGVIVVGKERVVEEPQDPYFQYTGRRRPSAGWRNGVYRAEISLTRPRADSASVTQTVRRELVIR